MAINLPRKVITPVDIAPYHTLLVGHNALQRITHKEDVEILVTGYPSATGNKKEHSTRDILAVVKGGNPKKSNGTDKPHRGEVGIATLLQAPSHS